MIAGPARPAGAGQRVDWLAVDWGTSRLRVWAMDASDRVIAARSSADGMGSLTPAGFEAALTALAGDWLDGATPDRPLRGVICGMAGARGGWAEAGYAMTPCAPAGALALGSIPAPTAATNLDVRILPGLAQSDPPDVMRGEETQLAGFVAARSLFTGTVGLPGTHSKWARLSDGCVTGFATAMTGEIFALLARQSILRLTLPAETAPIAPDRDFTQAVAEALARPAEVPAALFGLRAAALLGAADPARDIARLSGLLIGGELAAMGTRIAAPVALIGAEPLTSLYAAALAQMGLDCEALDAGAVTLAGLSAARRDLWKDDR